MIREPTTNRGPRTLIENIHFELYPKIFVWKMSSRLTESNMYQTNSPSISDPNRVQFAMTTAGFLVPTVTAILSTFSSLLILFIIYKSSQKLSNTYHRIMALMSIFDLIASVSMSLTTLPMPSDDIFRFAGPMLGNPLTCSLQGYFLTMGCCGSSSLYMCLSWYYVCRMTLMVDPYSIYKRIEPVFYIFTVTMALVLPSYCLQNNFFHTVRNDQFCVIAIDHSLPYTDRDYESLRNVQVAVIYLIGFTFLMIMVAMVIIIWTISSKNRAIKKILEEQSIRDCITGKDDHDAENDEESKSISKLLYSRVVVIQALMYVFAYLITWMFMIIPMAIRMHPSIENTIEVFKSVLFPLPGFWNLIIFLFDKVYLVSQNNCDGFWKSIQVVFSQPTETNHFILSCSLKGVKNDGSIHEMLNNLDLSSSEEESGMPNGSSSEEVLKKHGIVAVRSGNRQVYFSTNGLRRTGEVDIQESNISVQSSNSIQTPAGFVSHDASWLA